jgi:hypothetical protein
MVIVQFIVGCIMGIYLMEIFNGYVFSRKVMAAVRRAGFHHREG